MADADAVRLFAHRAACAQPHFRLTDDNRAWSAAGVSTGSRSRWSWPRALATQDRASPQPGRQRSVRPAALETREPAGSPTGKGGEAAG
ncbi:hypothetical protein QFZ67_006535 [Streptomyces sp. V1I1]|nr:hypothetical protein [Streptomyces sp. V1I1]MDQ0944830.1 hypothetical protein [Streptomyces sp. V1I1]